MQTDFFNAVETEQRNVKDIANRDAEETQEVLAGARAVRSGAHFLYNRTYGFHGFVYQLLGSLSPHWDIFQQDVFKVTS